ncbi:MAG: chromate efflux transporter [Paracoccus sp. (in: a-proteobacteria)]|uniref:chromate efflux transporter n=1 Tax=Paracoccus sp. TaxID=267 RepID=UPI0026DF5365|nr:chromate efflux transporter [Paracoccus sp. (in: a-proteobacteria)]MDO5620143.1 chromate efflux transporter [Paracoccus sp. (in: a-proteobacteria)]
MIRDDTQPAGLWHLFLIFLRLGLTSFGGPVAHIGYFRDEFVIRRRWMTDHAFADLLALCQFLPGPASSQMNFAIGYARGGIWGAMLAFAGFTLPSALVLMLLAALWGTAPPDGLAGGLIHGLKLVAVAVVAHALLGMARSLAPDGPRAGVALAALAVVSLWPGMGLAQIAAIALGAAIGAGLRLGPSVRDGQMEPGIMPSRRTGTICLALFALLLATVPLLAQAGLWGQIFASFYGAGALVFGGGHVVLPLLETGTVSTGLVSADSFLAGYGAAQAVPGPLFTFAAWLGQVAGGVPGALLALAAVFLPGLLLVMGALPFWTQISTHPQARHAMAGANAAVVGILGAALYQPVFTSAVLSPADFTLAVGLFLMLTIWNRPAWQVVLAGLILGTILTGIR